METRLFMRYPFTSLLLILSLPSLIVGCCGQDALVRYAQARPDSADGVQLATQSAPCDGCYRCDSQRSPCPCAARHQCLYFVAPVSGASYSAEHAEQSGVEHGGLGWHQLPDAWSLGCYEPVGDTGLKPSRMRRHLLIQRLLI